MKKKKTNTKTLKRLITVMLSEKQIRTTRICSENEVTRHCDTTLIRCQVLRRVVDLLKSPATTSALCFVHILLDLRSFIFFQGNQIHVDFIQSICSKCYVAGFLVRFSRPRFVLFPSCSVKNLLNNKIIRLI